MKLLAINGSPRGEKANSDILLNEFINGFMSINNKHSELDKCDKYILMKNKNMDIYLKMFKEYDAVIIAFPLYVDQTPSIVKELIESLKPMIHEENKPKIGFIVQCGFVEANHIKQLERYLNKLSNRIGSEYLGTIYKGNGEGIRQMPREATVKLREQLNTIGEEFAKTHSKFNDDNLKKFRGMEKIPKLVVPLVWLLNKTGLLNLWWNKQLKENNVYECRYDKPYC